MNFKLYNVVRLSRDLPEHRLSVGTRGAIVAVYTQPAGYEIEFCDSAGTTLALVSLSHDDANEMLEPVTKE